VIEPIRCSCEQLNDPWRRYCGRCGNALGTSCRCGFPNREEDRYCGGCGVTVSPRPPAKVAAVLRLPPPTVRPEVELYEEMRTRRIEVRGSNVPSPEATQRMETLAAPPSTDATQRLDPLADTAIDPSTHRST
jgi:hypothetical protein